MTGLQLGFARTDDWINFDWSLGTPGVPLPSDGFSIRWTGFLRPPTTGWYSFVITDDGMRFFIDGSRLVSAARGA